MKKVGTGLLAVVLIAGACSSGVSDELHEAALDEARTANQRVADLESSVEEVEAQLRAAEDDRVGLEDELAREMAQRSNAEAQAAEFSDQWTAGAQKVARLEADLEAAVQASVAAEERFGDLVDLTNVPNTPAATLISVLTRGVLRCGIAGGIRGFSYRDPSDGTITGFDADFCRAVAAAVLRDPEAVEFIPTGPADRFDAVRFGDVDVLVRNTTWTLNRDAALGLVMDFGPTIFYDGQQFLGRSDQFTAVSGAADVDQSRLCVAPGSFPEQQALDWANSGGSALSLAPPAAGTIIEMLETLQNGTCDLLTTDGSILASWRLSGIEAGAVVPDELVIFPPTPISREPLSPVYRQGDTVWADIVNWVVFTTIIADEKGIDSTNIDTAPWDAELRRLFGADGDLVAAVGLEPDAFYQVIKQVGNYREIFERNLGPLGITRVGTPNAPHTEGGLIFAPPAR
jgi:general L-amino acid transport system substrate-binding protein